MDKRKRILIIVILIIVLVLLYVIVSNVFVKEDYNNYKEGVYIVPGEYKDPDIIKVTNKNLKAEKCIDDICISNVYIECTKNQGTIYFTAKNNGSETKSGYLRLYIDDFNTIIIYSKVKPGKTKEGFSGYLNHDLRKASSFKIEKLTYEEYTQLVK